MSPGPEPAVPGQRSWTRPGTAGPGPSQSSAQGARDLSADRVTIARGSAPRNGVSTGTHFAVDGRLEHLSIGAVLHHTAERYRTTGTVECHRRQPQLRLLRVGQPNLGGRTAVARVLGRHRSREPEVHQAHRRLRRCERETAERDCCCCDDLHCPHLAVFHFQPGLSSARVRGWPNRCYALKDAVVPDRHTRLLFGTLSRPTAQGPLEELVVGHPEHSTRGS